MTPADVERLRAAYESEEHQFIPLRDMLGYVSAEQLEALRANGLREYGIELEGEAAPVRAVEAHEFVDACIELAFAREFLEVRGDLTRTPTAH